VRCVCWPVWTAASIVVTDSPGRADFVGSVDRDTFYPVTGQYADR
jgi:hypothetical protein